MSSSTSASHAQSATVTSSSDAIAERIVVSSESSESNAEDVDAEEDDDGTGDVFNGLRLGKTPVAASCTSRSNGAAEPEVIDVSGDQDKYAWFILNAKVVHVI